MATDRFCYDGSGHTEGGSKERQAASENCSSEVNRPFGDRPPPYKEPQIDFPVTPSTVVIQSGRLEQTRPAAEQDVAQNLRDKSMVSLPIVSFGEVARNILGKGAQQETANRFGKILEKQYRKDHHIPQTDAPTFLAPPVGEPLITSRNQSEIISAMKADKSLNKIYENRILKSETQFERLSQISVPGPGETLDQMIAGLAPSAGARARKVLSQAVLDSDPDLKAKQQLADKDFASARLRGDDQVRATETIKPEKWGEIVSRLNEVDRKTYGHPGQSVLSAMKDRAALSIATEQQIRREEIRRKNDPFYVLGKTLGNALGF